MPTRSHVNTCSPVCHLCLGVTAVYVVRFVCMKDSCSGRDCIVSLEGKTSLSTYVYLCVSHRDCSKMTMPGYKKEKPSFTAQLDHILIVSLHLIHYHTFVKHVCRSPAWSLICLLMTNFHA